MPDSANNSIGLHTKRAENTSSRHAYGDEKAKEINKLFSFYLLRKARIGCKNEVHFGFTPTWRFPMNDIKRDLERKFLHMSSAFKAVMVVGARDSGYGPGREKEFFKWKNVK